MQIIYDCGEGRCNGCLYYLGERGESDVNSEGKFRLTVSKAAKKVDNMMQTMASQNRVPFAPTMASPFSVVSLDDTCDMLSIEG